MYPLPFPLLPKPFLLYLFLIWTRNSEVTKNLNLTAGGQYLSRYREDTRPVVAIDKTRFPDLMAMRMMMVVVTGVAVAVIWAAATMRRGRIAHFYAVYTAWPCVRCFVYINSLKTHKCLMRWL